MWKVQLLGDIHDQDQLFELSAIQEDNKFGQRSWGWGGPEKIILFSDGPGGNHLNPRSKESIDFALSTAEKVVQVLNN